MPDKRDQTICFTTTQEMRQSIDDLAEKREIGRSSLLREIIRAYLNKVAEEE